jgi:hypothetical protein
MKKFIIETNRLQELAGIVLEDNKPFTVDGAFNDSPDTADYNTLFSFFNTSYWRDRLPTSLFSSFESKFKGEPVNKKEYLEWILSNVNEKDEYDLLTTFKTIWNSTTLKEKGNQKNIEKRTKVLDKLIGFFNKKGVNINTDLKYISPSSGDFKISSSDVYDFGGSEGPIPNSVVVDIKEPEGDNKFIEQDLETEFNLPQKQYINLSSIVHFIKNKSNLAKSIDNSLKPGGILVLKTSLKDALKMLSYLSNYTLLEAYINKEEVIASEDDPDAISIVFQKS